MDTNIKPVTRPEEAIDQFVGEQYMEWLMTYLDHEIKSWPSLQQIAEAKPRPEKIKKFMMQRFLAAEAFIGGRDGDPGFLGFAIANLSESSDPVAEHALELLENKRREEVSGMASTAEQSTNIHRQLWIKLLHALGAGDEEIQRSEVKEPTRNYVAELADVYSNAEWQTAMAAFAAHERLIPEEYGAIAAMLRDNLQLTPADMEILTWHAKGDTKYVIETNHILERAAVDEEGKSLIFEGVRRQLEARRDFYSAQAGYLYE
jgi:thiaminase